MLDFEELDGDGLNPLSAEKALSSGISTSSRGRAFTIMLQNQNLYLWTHSENLKAAVKVSHAAVQHTIKVHKNHLSDFNFAAKLRMVATFCSKRPPRCYRDNSKGFDWLHAEHNTTVAWDQLLVVYFLLRRPSQYSGEEVGKQLQQDYNYKTTKDNA